MLRNNHLRYVHFLNISIGLLFFCVLFGIDIWLKVDVEGKNTYLYSAIRHEGRVIFGFICNHWIH